MSTSPSGDQAGFYRQVDLVGRPEVTPEQAAANRVRGRGIVRPRPGQRGLLRISGPTLWRLVGVGTFPRPIKIGAITAWPKAVVHAWIAAQLEPRPAGNTNGAQQAVAAKSRARSRGRFAAPAAGDRQVRG
jgi:predicted DNA-binding transcriptional regulator AlpA